MFARCSLNDIVPAGTNIPCKKEESKQCDKRSCTDTTTGLPVESWDNEG
jgi:hypothetical protein